MVKDTSWQKSSKWYKQHFSQKKSYNHEKLILPKLYSLLSLKEGDSLLDLGCGQGVLAEKIKTSTQYVGLDASKSLIEAAKDHYESANCSFFVQDITKPFDLKKKFTHAVFVLSLQNMADPQKALLNASNSLKKNGKLILVLNHPCFRIPKHSSWEFLEDHQGQYRRIDRYLTPFKSSLKTHPSKGKNSPITWSFHNPLSKYFQYLNESDFLIENLYEITSDKKSYGKGAKPENFARKEFPLFMILVAVKK